MSNRKACNTGASAALMQISFTESDSVVEENLSAFCPKTIVAHVENDSNSILGWIIRSTL